MRFTACLALALLCAPPAPAASPSLGGVQPRGGQRGTELVLTFSGNNLADAREVLFYTPGFQVTKLEPVNNNQFKATVKIAPDCKLGEHVLRVRTATGVTDLRTFWVGPFPAVAEKEPNNEFAAPQPVPLNVTVEGVVQREDVDHFRVEAKKGQRISVEVEGMRLAGAMFDPYVAILDAKRFELATSDDSPLFKQDGCLSVLAPEDGAYVIQVRESSYGGSDACQYRLHVGTFPRPLAAVPAGGKAGEEVEVRLLGDPAGEIRQKVKLPPAPDPDFGIEVTDAHGTAPSRFPLRVSDFPNVVEAEPNEDHNTATRGALPCAFNGVIGKEGDVDHFRFPAKKGETFDVRCHARGIGSPLDPVMTVLAAGGGGVVGNDDAGGPDSAFRFTAPADGEYVVQVRDHLGKGGPAYFYRVEFAPVRPRLTLSLQRYGNTGSQERQTISVPRGNRYAVLVNAARADFGGELHLGAEGLPDGVTLTTEPMAANMTSVPVLFEAKPDAAVAGKLAVITGKHADPKQQIPSSFSQGAELVVSDPGQSVYWQVAVDRVAVAVTEAAPFRVSIVQPKAPLVQNGSMNLKVVAERQAGFDAPITVIPLYNPPGVGSAGSVTIPQGQSEVLFPLNANGGAPARTWKYAVLAYATVGDGPVWVSSQLADLTISPPYVSFALERTAVEQGKQGQIYCKVAVAKPFEGEATAKLIGLPAKVTTQDVKLTKDAKEIVFPVNTEAGSPAGTHKGLFCQVFITENGEQIVQNTGGTELRIDPPPPPKADAPPMPAAPPPAAKPAAAPEKRLSRLEQLRLEQQEREKAAAQGGAPKEPEKK